MANSKRKCLTCKERGKVEIGIVCNLGFFCSDNCRKQYGINKASILVAKQKNKRIKENKQAARDLNKKTVKWQHTQTQISFNKMRVLQEKLWYLKKGQQPECISCGKKEDFCCGHFKTRGSQGNLRYDVKNTYLQCNKYCNMSLSGNINGDKSTRGYTQGLFDRFGDEQAEGIIHYCETSTEVKKWAWQELEAMRKEFNKNIRELEQELLPWTF